MIKETIEEYQLKLGLVNYHINYVIENNLNNRTSCHLAYNGSRNATIVFDKSFVESGSNNDIRMVIIHKLFKLLLSNIRMHLEKKYSREKK